MAGRRIAYPQLVPKARGQRILTGRPGQLQELVGPGVQVLDIQPGDQI